MVLVLVLIMRQLRLDLVLDFIQETHGVISSDGTILRSCGKERKRKPSSFPVSNDVSYQEEDRIVWNVNRCNKGRELHTLCTLPSYRYGRVWPGVKTSSSSSGIDFYANTRHFLEKPRIPLLDADDAGMLFGVHC